MAARSYDIDFAALIVDELPDAVIVASPQGRILYWNPGAEAMFGYGRDECIGHSTYEMIVPGEGEDEERRIFLKTLEAGSAVVESLRRRKDGTLVYVEISAKAVAANGKNPLVIMSQKDVTPLKVRRDSALLEARFHDLLESMPDGIIMVNATGHVVLANGHAEEHFGYSPGGLLGLCIEELLPERFRLAHIGHRARYALQRQTRMMGTGIELVGLRKDGSEFPVQISLSPLRFDQTAVSMVAIRDMSEHTRAEKKYRDLFENAPVAMFRTGRFPRIVDSNAAMRRLLGYSADELRGLRVRDLIPDGDAALIERVQELWRRRSDRIEFEHRLIKKNGGTIWVISSASLTGGDGKEAEAMVVHIQDITARKLAEEQLFHAQKMEALGNLAGGIAHDFNNMLLPVIALAEISKDELPVDNPVQQNLDAMLEAAHRASQLVNRILTFSRQDESEVAEIDASDCVANAFQLLRNVLPATITVVDEVGRDVGMVIADAAQLQSMIMNLGSNAADAMEGRVGKLFVGLTGVTVEAPLSERLRLRPGARYARITMRDTGIGMDQETLAKIFNPFFTTKPVGQGTGLGLAMVHGIVERLDGGIDVMSELGAGTTFDIYLPLR